MEIENHNQEEMLIKEVSLPLFNSKGWIKFLGIFAYLQDFSEGYY